MSWLDELERDDPDVDLIQAVFARQDADREEPHDEEERR